MNKQELIDKAVEKYQGKIPENGEVIITHHEDLFFVPERYAVSDPIHVHVCTAEQFNQRARELGWCNGYKYGVEYETNGKKPDLHPSVIVQVRIKGAKHFGEPLTIFEIIHWDKPNGSFHPFSFRIVDPRYKPVEAEQAQDEKPKKDLSDLSIELSLIAHELIDAGEVEAAKRLTELSKEIANKQRQKLADEEKQKFVEAVINAIEDKQLSRITIAETLYESGLFELKNKAAS